MTKKIDTNAVTADSSVEAFTVDQSNVPAADDVCDDIASFETRKLRKRSNSHVSGASGASDKSSKQPQNATATIEVPDAPDKIKSPFDELIKAAAILNPRQFELPRNMNIFVQFPGGDKSKQFGWL